MLYNFCVIMSPQPQMIENQFSGEFSMHSLGNNHADVHLIMLTHEICICLTNSIINWFLRNDFINSTNIKSLYRYIKVDENLVISKATNIKKGKSSNSDMAK